MTLPDITQLALLTVESARAGDARTLRHSSSVVVVKVRSSSSMHALALAAREARSVNRSSAARSGRPMVSQSSTQYRSAWRHTR